MSVLHLTRLFLSLTLAFGLTAVQAERPAPKVSNGFAHTHGHASHDSAHRRKGSDHRRKGHCNKTRKTGELSRRCFDALVQSPEIDEILHDRTLVPGLADGRIGIDEISHTLRIAESVPGSRSRGIEPDPDEDAFIGRRVLDEMRGLPQFDIASEVLTRQGPILLERFVPPPETGFPFAPIPENKNYLDIPGFTLDLHNTLAASVNGYAMRMRKDGTTVATLQWNWARNPTPADSPAAGWNTNRRIHIVSLSKFMTAIGLVKLLKQKGIDTESKIINWLPAYWAKGPNIGLINFEDLMNHLSGFGTGGSSSSWATMKTQVAGGVSAADVGVNGDYENMNFGLARVLMATIGGYIHPATNFGIPFINDAIWNALTSSAYNQYMQTHVFNAHGAFPRLTKTTTTALASRYDASGNGWNSGSFVATPGGVGWHMTVNEVLNIARALRTGQIISGLDAQILLNESWGLNSPINGFDTAAGRLYYKPGLWTDNGNPAVARTEQVVLLMAPDNIEIVVFINSEIGPGGQSLQNLVRTLYVNNIVIVP